MTEKIEIYKKFLNLLENLSTDKEEYKKLLHDNIVQIEYPNLINKKITERNIENNLQGVERAKKILAKQRYDINNYFEAGERLVIECTWTGQMAIDAGHLKKDQELKAYICMIIEFKDNKIIKQSNYDCYEPF